MPAPIPVILAMTLNYVAVVGYSVHVHTTAGEMDITLTEMQYLGIRAQLSDSGRATVPGASAAAA